MRTRITKLSFAFVACTLVAAACSSSAKSSGPGGTSATTLAPNASDPAINQWAIDYTHGTLKQASGTPYKIGYINDDSFFPEATIGVNAAVAYANAELNGADGSPIQVEECKVVNAADGTKCGDQMANDPSIKLVLTGTLLNGNQEMYDALTGKKAVIIGNGVTPADFVTKAGKAFVAGAPGVLAGMAQFAVNTFHPKKVALLYDNNPAGQAGANVIMAPIFAKAGAKTTNVAVDDTAAEPDMESAMNAANVAGSDVFVSIFTLQNCINMYDAMKSLQITTKVVTTGLCFGTKMADHLHKAGDSGDYPDGWYFGGYGYSYYLPSSTPGMQSSGMNTYLAKVHQYGKPAPGANALEYSGFAGPMFGNVLTAIKFINELGGPAKSTIPALTAKINNFKGPMMLQVGKLNCNQPVYVSVCGVEMGIQQYKNKQWISIADGHNGKPIVVG
jgi:hypothetical protein